MAIMSLVLIFCLAAFIALAVMALVIFANSNNKKCTGCGEMFFDTRDLRSHGKDCRATAGAGLHKAA